MSHQDDNKKPETVPGEAASSGTSGPRRAANLRRTLSGLGVDPSCFTADHSPGDVSHPPTLLRLPTVSLAAPRAIPPAAEEPVAIATATPAVVAAVAPMAETPQVTPTVQSLATDDAPRPRPEPPTDWQNIVIQWLAAGLAAVAVMVIFTKWRDRPVPPVNMVDDALRLQVSAPPAPDDETELPPEPPRLQDKSVRMAGATRQDRTASPVARPAPPASTSTRDESLFHTATPFEPSVATAQPNEVDGDHAAASAPSVPDTAAPDEDDDLSYVYPRTNPATYLYIDPPAANEPRFQPRGASGMATRGVMHYETRGNQ